MKVAPALALLLFFTLAAPAASTAPPSPPSVKPLQKVRLALKFYHQFQFAGYYAALWQGYYTEAGLDVEIFDAATERSSLEAVLGGRAEFGVSGMDLLRARAHGAPVVATAMVFQHSPVIILSLPGSPIHSPADLAGKRVMGSREDLFEAAALLKLSGLPLDAVHWLPHQDSVSALLQGQIDASVDYISNEPNQLRRLGHSPKIIRPVEYGVDFYGDILFTTEKFAKSKPALVEAFTSASLRGWRFALDNPDSLIPQILELPGVKERGLDPDHLRYEAREIKKLIIPELVEIGHINPYRIRTITEALQEKKLLPKNFQPDSFIFHPHQSPSIPLKTWLITAGSLAAAAAAFAMLWHSSLQRRAARLSRQIKEATEKALSASKRKADFLGIMSHELRTPLNGILGPAVLLRDEAPSPQAKELLEALTHHACLLLALIDSLLDAAASGSPSSHFKNTTTLDEVLNDCWHMAKLQITNQPHGRLTRQWHPGLPLTAKVDPQLLRRAILLCIHLLSQSSAAPIILWRIEPHPERENWWEFDFSSPAPPPNAYTDFSKNFVLDKNHPSSGLQFALLLLQQTCAALGGSARIETLHGRETKLVCSLPLPAPASRKG